MPNVPMDTSMVSPAMRALVRGREWAKCLAWTSDVLGVDRDNSERRQSSENTSRTTSGLPERKAMAVDPKHAKKAAMENPHEQKQDYFQGGRALEDTTESHNPC